MTSSGVDKRCVILVSRKEEGEVRGGIYMDGRWYLEHFRNVSFSSWLSNKSGRGRGYTTMLCTPF